MLERTAPVTVAAILVHNEAELIGLCLAALDGQVGAQLSHIVLVANNCTDDTVQLGRSAAISPGTTLHVIEMHLPPKQSSAGHPRRLAMQRAAALAGPDGILLTVDGDARVDPTMLWKEKDSPFPTVATLTVTAQDSCDAAQVTRVDEALWFSVWTGLTAHRLLGNINRARKASRGHFAAFGAWTYACPIHEPDTRS